MHTKIYYLYSHFRPDKQEIFYFGIGTKRDKKGNNCTIYDRAFSKNGRNNYWQNIVNLNPDYIINIIEESSDRKYIEFKEIELIRNFGRVDIGTGRLSNLCSGGEGTSDISESNRLLVSKRIKNWIKENSTERTAKIREKQGVPVIILDLNNNILKQVNSLGEATEFTNVPKQQINNVLAHNTKSAKNYVFVRTRDFDFSENYSITRNNGKHLQKCIEMLSLDNVLINTFNSTREAFKFLNKKQGTAISNALSKKSRKAYGYKWRYKE